MMKQALDYHSNSVGGTQAGEIPPDFLDYLCAQRGIERDTALELLSECILTVMREALNKVESDAD